VNKDRDEAICDYCGAFPRWRIANLEGDAMEPIIRWFACGRCLHSVLADGRWALDAVQVYDWERAGERS
jgi:hypothetical protein